MLAPLQGHFLNRWRCEDLCESGDRRIFTEPLLERVQRQARRFGGRRQLPLNVVNSLRQRGSQLREGQASTRVDVPPAQIIATVALSTLPDGVADA